MSRNEDTSVSEHVLEGHKIVLVKLVLGRTPNAQVIPLTDVEKIPAGDIIEIEELKPEPFPEPEPSTDPQPSIERDQHAEWVEAKAKWEKQHPETPNLRKVKFWLPVFQVVRATIDGATMKIFHTLRGPIMGVVQHEDTIKANLYSPCYLDPNIEKGRVHYLPISFAGFEFTLYKATCIGESVPQIAEIQGYPSFIEANRRGLYQYRMKGAYHHIEADLPEDAPVHSVSRDVRAHQEGLVPTSNTGEAQAIIDSRIANTKS